MTTPARPHGHPDADHRFFIFCPQDTQFYYFATAAERDQYNDTVIRSYLDDGWDEQVEGVVAGELTHVCQQIDRLERPPADQIDDEGHDLEGRYWDPCWSHHCDYALQPLVDVPAEANPDPHDTFALQLLGAASKQLALHDYGVALVEQTRALIAGQLDINTARRQRASWDAALLQRLSELSGAKV